MKARWERADRDNKRLSEEVSNLRNVIATMQAAPPPAAPATPPELQAQSLITPQEMSDYGEEFLNVVGKKAREIAGAEISQLKQQIEQLSRGMQTTTQMTIAQARDTMLKELDENLPAWRDLNTDPNFIAWLRLPDAFSGAIRHDLLKDAYDQNNTARVSAFFQGFLAEEAAVAPANAPPATPRAAPAQRVPLETFAAPGRAKSAAAQAPAEKPIITRAQVTAFYADVAAGKYRGREQEKNRLEAEIFSATNEGRLR
jgi:cell division septum initiation protein DivIVA